MRNYKQSTSKSGGKIQEDLSDEVLVDQVARGDSAALETLYQRYASKVLGIVLRAIGDNAMAEDVLQETFWRVWRNAASFQSQRGAFAGWLFKIARNLVIDSFRKRNARPQTLKTDHDDPGIESAPDPETDVAEQAYMSLKRQQVQKALAALPWVQRQVIEMAYFYGMTRQEIAEATGEALGTIHTRARLGLQKLRQELQKQGFED